MIRRDDLIEQLNYSPFIKRYREITVTNNEFSNLVDFQICIEIGGDFLEKANPNNLILVDENNLIYPYWIEEWKRPSGKAKIWTKIDLNASEIKKFKLYYQGIIGDNSPNGSDVFIFFDDFDGDSLNLNKWEEEASSTGSYSVNNNILEIKSSPVSGWSSEILYSKQNFGNNIYIEGKVKPVLNPSVSSTSMCCWADLRAYEDSNNQYHLSFRGDGSKTNGRVNIIREVENGSSAVIEKNNRDYNEFWQNKKYWIGSTNKKVWLNSELWNEASHSDSYFNDVGLFLGVGTHDDADDDTILYVDYVFVRKYTASKPTISISSEKILYV